MNLYLTKFRPLPNRTQSHSSQKTRTIKLTTHHIFHSIEKAIEYAEIQGEQELFIIGGGEIYQLALPYADTIYLTEVDASLDGHAYFPVFDKQIFKETLRSHHALNDIISSFNYVTYQKK